jgi:RNA polymerase sigma factor (sigma-70 family)
VTSERRARRFATTRWTIVTAAGRQSDVRSARALEELCEIYWPPLYGYLRGRGYSPDASQDLTQGFFARLLQTGGIRAADQARGRFRAFMLTALKRYVINEHERQTTARRGGRHLHFSLDFEHAERRYAQDRRDDDSPDRVFDRKWAAIALTRAFRRLEEECQAAGKGHLARALLPYLTDTGDLPGYRTVAADLHITEGAVKVAVHRLRRRYGAILRLEIGETVLNSEDVDVEMRELLRVVSA